MIGKHIAAVAAAGFRPGTYDDFNWQLGYELAEPLKVPVGTHIVVAAHFDNSINNRFNPDPNRTVYYGEMSWEEMMHALLSVVVDKDVDPRTIVGRRRPAAATVN